jgi:hypothetical protein
LGCCCGSGSLSHGDWIIAFIAFATRGATSSVRWLLRIHQGKRVVDFGAEEA